MKLGRGSVLALWCLALGSPTALAQESGPPEVEAVGTEGGDTAAEPAAEASKEAEARYHLAFEFLSAGEVEAARRLLQALLTDTPDHPLAERARTLIENLDLTAAAAARGEGATLPPPPEPAAETPGSDDARGPRSTGTARAELLFFQTLHGIALGAELCVMAECDEVQPWVASLMAGAGVGFGVSWWLSDDGVTPGLARALTDGVWFGVGNGVALLLATDAFDGGDEELRVGGILAGSQLVGLALGAGLYSAWEPTPGQVSLTLSGSLWTTVAASQFIGMVSDDLGEQGWGVALLAAIDLGALGGGYLASRERMSAGRVLLIDAGGLLGTLGGLGLAVLAQGEDAERVPTLGLGLLGTLSGLGLAYALTDNWDTDHADESHAPPLNLALLPTPNGVTASLQGTW